MKIKASLLAGLIASAPFALAQVEVATDPVGYVSVDLTAASDTRISLPVTRAPEFQGIPESVSGNSITFAAGTGLQLTESAYFVAVRGGTLAGTRATVVGTEDGGDTLVLEDGADLTGLATGEGGDPVQLIPHWTMATLFPADIADGTEVLVWDGDTSGINIAASSVYEYNGTNWMDGPFTEVDDNVIHQTESIIVRSASGDTINLVIAGSVPMFPHSSSIGTLSGNQSQDVFIGVTVPAPTSLADSNLGVTEGMELLVPANADAGINKAAESVFEFTGGAWMDGPFTNVDDYELQPGVGYTVRLPGTNEPESFAWSFNPSYVE